jgi:hypothetical protein
MDAASSAGRFKRVNADCTGRYRTSKHRSRSAASLQGMVRYHSSANLEVSETSESGVSVPVSGFSVVSYVSCQARHWGVLIF